jgi:hypothetical protein
VDTYEVVAGRPRAETNALLMATTDSELTSQLPSIGDCTVDRFPMEKHDG